MAINRVVGAVEISQRYFFKLGRSAPIDEHGLLDDAKAELSKRSGHAFELQQLTELPEKCILLLGPADAGKSFAVSSLRKWLSQQPGGTYVLFTDIRTSTARLEPQYWNEWRKSEQKAIWFVDSIDEAPAGWHASDAVIEQIGALGPFEQDRLRVIITCRENEIPSEFEHRIGNTWSNPLSLRISAPSRSNAKDICGSQENLDRALSLIEKYNLQEIAEHPAALKFLGKLETHQATPTEASIWQQIIELLLEEPMLAHGKPQTALSTRFKAAARIAFLLEFSNIEEINIDGAATSLAPRLDTLFDDASEMVLLNAAREAVRSPLFRNVGGLRRIQSRHLREWLAAWQLKALSEPEAHAERVREIIGNYDSADWPSAPVATLLAKILSDENSPLKNWLNDQLKKDALSITSHITQLLDTLERAPFAVNTSRFTETLTDSQPESVLDAVLAQAAPLISTRPPHVQQSVLEIAARLRSQRLASFATSVLNNPTDPENLQLEALTYLEAIGERLDYRSLAQKANKQHTKLLSYILFLGLRAGTIPVKEVIKDAPQPAAHIGDYRSLLAHEIGEHLDVDSAFEIIRTAPNRGIYDYEQSPNAVRRLTQEPALSAVRVFETLEDAQRHKRYETVDLIEKLLAQRQDIRHELYSSILQRDNDNDYVIRNTLRPDDLPWLRNQLESTNTPPQRLVVDLYRMTHVLEEEAKQEILRLLRHHAPQQLEGLLTDAARFQQEMAARFPEEPPPQRIDLATVIQSQLDRADTTYEERLRVLGWLAFGEKNLRPSDVEGTFEELSPELRERVFNALAEPINKAAPTQVPFGNSIPGDVLFEGAAINAAIRRFGAQSFMPDVLAKWLPTLLRQLENDDVIEMVSEVAPLATIAAYTDFIRRDVLSESSTTYSAYHAPVRLWALGLAEEVEQILLSSEVPNNKGKAALLHECRRRAPRTAERVARAWTELQPISIDCRNAALSVLLHSQPEFALLSLDKEVQTSGETALLGIIGEFDRWGDGRGILLTTWDEKLIAHLATLLFRFFPESKDPSYIGAHFITKQDEAISVRGACIARLFEYWNAGSSTALATLREFARTEPLLMSRIRMRLAEKRATQLVQTAAANLGTHAKSSDASPPLPPSGSEPPPGLPPPGLPPTWRRGKPLWSQLLRLIRDAFFRIPRTNEELLRVVVEVLERISNSDDLAEDHELFVRSNGSRRERETVLQAYVFRRLSDLMQGNVVDRESWIPVNNKVDIRIRTSNPEPLEVPLEVKWSDDPRTSTAASEQLGEKYMTGPRRTHGVYLVGWCGRPAESKIKDAVSRSILQFESSRPGRHIGLVWWPIRIAKRPKAKARSGQRKSRPSRATRSTKT